MLKRYLYYFSPFVLIPAVSLLCDYMDDIGLINMSIFIITVLLALISIAVGILSPTHRRFDYVMVAIMPLAFFGVMFISGFLDRGCSGQLGLSLNNALEIAFQPWCLMIYCVMAVSTLVASLKSIRISKKLNSK